MGEENIIKQVLDKLEQRRDDGLVHRTFGVRVKAASINEETRTLRVIFSSEAVDSYDEVVAQDWKGRIARFERNPVVLWNHNRFGFLGWGGDAAEVLPIGHASNWEFDAKGSEADITFVDEKANPIAEMVYQGFKQGSIRAVSVGFFPHKVIEERDEDGTLLSRTLQDNELFEISAVPLPANFEAVALSAGQVSFAQGSARDVEDKRLRQMALKQGNLTVMTKGRKAAPAPPEPPPNKEIDMNEKDFEKAKARIAELEAQNKTLTASAEQAQAATKASEEKASKAAEAQKAAEEKATKLEEAATKAKALADEAVKQAEELELKLAESEIKVLVGKKITPNQIKHMVELRVEKGEEWFKQHVADMPNLKLDEQITGDKGKSDKDNTKARKKSALVARLEKEANA